MSFSSELVALRPRLFGYAKKLAHKTTEAEDLLQETYLRCLQYQSQYREGSHLDRWAMTIMRNIFLTDVRRKKVVSGCDPILENYLVQPPPQQSRLDMLDFLDAFDELAEDKKVVVLACGAMGYTLEEVSEATGAPVGTIKSRLHRARAKLQKTLAIDSFHDFGADSISLGVAA